MKGFMELPVHLLDELSLNEMVHLVGGANRPNSPNNGSGTCDGANNSDGKCNGTNNDDGRCGGVNNGIGVCGETLM